MDRTAARENGNALWSMVLVSALTLVGMQVVRALFPLALFTNALTEFAIKPRTVAVTLLAIVLAPFLAPLLTRILRPNRLFTISMVGAAALRFGMQISPSANLNLYLAIVCLMLLLIGCVAGLTLFEPSPQGRFRLVAGLVMALSLDAALNSAFLTWDFLWRRDVVSFVLALVLCGSILYSAYRLTHSKTPAAAARIDWSQAVTVGAFFALQMLYLQNIGSIAAMSDLNLGWAGVLILIGDAVGFLAAAWTYWSGLSARVPLVMGIVLVIVLGVLPTLSGFAVALAVIAAQALLAIVLCASITRKPTSATSDFAQHSRRVGLATLVFIGLLLLQFATYQIVLPYDGTIAPLAAGLLMLPSLAKLSSLPTIPNAGWRYAAIPILLAVIPLSWALRSPDFPTALPATPSLRLVDYNIHQGVNTDGWVDPEAIAAVIEAQNPDVVVLQEVIRGQVVAGGLDTAEWLSQRLRMRYYFVDAPDATFGNAILTRLPVVSWEHGLLPRGEAPQQRAYLLVRLDMGNGEPLTVIGTHLHHVEGQGNIRVPQAQRLLDVWDQQPHSLIVGDLNAHPDAPEMLLLADAGLVDSQAATDNGALFTNNSVEPFQRIDYVWGTPDLRFSEFTIPRTTASDHLPIAVTVSYPS